jgi:metallo-beta-lactamase class B
MIRHLSLFLAALPIAAALPARQTAQQRIDWNQPETPFRIAGNIYYVGTAGISAYLITDPKGDVLIDGALPESAPLIEANIRALGFDLHHIRYLLINHAHYDHAGGLAELKRATGAILLASAADTPDLERGRTSGRPDLAGFPSVHVDRKIGEGSHVRIGSTDLVTHMTPGHTRGCTSWTMHIEEAGKPLDVIFACSMTVAGEKLSGKGTYPGIVADFRSTFAKLGKMHADIFLSFHPAMFALEAKRKGVEAGHRFAFVDPEELQHQVSFAEDAFNAEVAAQYAAPAH